MLKNHRDSATGQGSPTHCPLASVHIAPGSVHGALIGLGMTAAPTPAPCNLSETDPTAAATQLGNPGVATASVETRAGLGSMHTAEAGLEMAAAPTPAPCVESETGLTPAATQSGNPGVATASVEAWAGLGSIHTAEAGAGIARSLMIAPCLEPDSAAASHTVGPVGNPGTVSDYVATWAESCRAAEALCLVFASTAARPTHAEMAEARVGIRRRKIVEPALQPARASTRQLVGEGLRLPAEGGRCQCVTLVSLELGLPTASSPRRAKALSRALVRPPPDHVMTLCPQHPESSLPRSVVH